MSWGAHVEHESVDSSIGPMHKGLEFILGQEWLHSLGKHETVPADGNRK